MTPSPPAELQPRDRVLLITQTTDILLNFRRELIQGLISKGAEVITAAPDETGNSALLQQVMALGVKSHHVLPIKRGSLNPLGELRALMATWRLLATIRPHAVIACMAKPIASAILPARLLGIRKRIAVVEGLGYAFTSGPECKRRIARLLLTLVYRGALPHSTDVIVLNPDDAAEIVQRGFARSSAVRLVPGIGVPDTYFHPSPLPSGAVTFIYVGRLLIDKGVRELLQAAALLRQNGHSFRLRLVGARDDNPACLNETEFHALLTAARAEWDGPAPGVLKELESAHVLVLPSYREGFPRSVMEGMAMGRPAIVTDVPGCRAAVVDGKTGFIVPAREPEALARAMARFIDDPALSEHLGAAAHSYALTHFRAHDIALDFMRTTNLAP